MTGLAPAVRAASLAGVVMAAAILTLPVLLHAQEHPSTATPGQATSSPRDVVASGERNADAGAGVVRGRVVEAGTGSPVPGARVGGGVRRTAGEVVLTDATGAFELSAVPAGTTWISASKPGYCGARGQPSGQRRLTVRAGETTQGVEVVLHRLSAIVGRVLDQAGEPVVGAHVSVHRRGRDGVQPYELAGASVQTDDLGHYRVHSLAPGEYLVGARPPTSMRQDAAPRAPADGARERAVPSYHPAATTAAAASWVTVGDATETSADIALQTAALGRIAGTVVDRHGRPVAAGAVNVRGTEDSPALRIVGAGFPIGPDGRFAIADVPPGSYRLLAVGHTSETDAAEADVVIDPGDDKTVTLAMRPGATVRGRLTLDGGGAEEFTGLEVRATALERDRFRFNQARAGVGADGSFELRGLRGAVRFEVGPALPPATTDARQRAPVDASRAWRVREVRVNGRGLDENALDTDDAQSLGTVELVAARDFASMAGTVVAPPGADAGSLIVVAVPAGATRIAHAWPWRNVWLATPSANGRFLMHALPPGDYDVVALQQPDDGPPPLDTESLARWRASAARVTLAASQVLELELRGVRVP